MFTRIPIWPIVKHPKLPGMPLLPGHLYLSPCDRKIYLNGTIKMRICNSYLRFLRARQ
jgi:hypothetical protein